MGAICLYALTNIIGDQEKERWNSFPATSPTHLGQNIIFGTPFAKTEIAGRYLPEPEGKFRK